MATVPVNANTKPAVDEIDRLIAALIKTGKAAGMSEAAIDKMVKEAKSAGTEGAKGIGGLNNELNKTNSILTTIGGGMATLFALDKIKQFVGEVVRVTAEFQRLEAVLTTTLGSKSEAQAALLQIQDLAKKTPFSVFELSESFVKLANRGVKPTMEQLNRLGDVAASLGKPFKEVVEAILDINNQVRWKEIGIKAETVGDKVKLSFRGMTQEVARTEQAVTEAIVAFGNMNGVTGTMNAISETLGGKISNLGDSWEQFLNTVGDGNNGVLTGAVTLLTRAVDKAKELLMTDSQERQKESLAIYTEQADKVKALYEQTGDADKARKIALENLHAQLIEVNKQLEESSALVKKLEHDDAQRAFAAFSTNDELEAEYIRNNQLVNQYNDLLNEGQKGILEQTARIKELEKAKRKSAELTDDEKKLLKEINEWQTESLNRDIQYWQRLNDEASKYLNTLYNGKGNPDDFVPEADAPEARDDSAYEMAKVNVARRKALIDDFKNYSLMAMEEVFAAQQYNVQRELAMLQQQYEYEIGLAGNNDKAKDKIRKDFQKKEAELLAKQARNQQEQALFNIAISQGPAIAKTVGNLGMPWAIPFIAAIGVLIASQLNRAKGVKQPRYAAEGDFDIKGPGTETSDSIPYMLSVRETVTPARATKKFGKLLKPMVEDKNLDWNDIRNIVDRELPTGLPAMIFANAGADSPEILNELRANRKAIENKQEVRIHFDENGFGQWIGNKGQWTKYLRGRYGV
jgi:hypothetical protein